LSIAALRGTRLQMIFPNIPKGGFRPMLQYSGLKSLRIGAAASRDMPNYNEGWLVYQSRLLRLSFVQAVSADSIGMD
jgi:hypothetical protein